MGLSELRNYCFFFMFYFFIYIYKEKSNLDHFNEALGT